MSLTSCLYIIYISALAGLATTLGAVVAIILGKPSDTVLTGMIAGAGGIMLSVVTLDLIPASLYFRQPAYFLTGLLSGILFMYLTNKLIAFLQITKDNRSGNYSRFKNLGLLIAIGIALHDLPEGMAIAAGEQTTSELGLLVALGIALHNLPEGMANAAPLLIAKMPKKMILLINLILSLFTPLGTMLGIWTLSAFKAMMPFLLSFAAGAMFFMTLTGLLPLAHERDPRVALIGGLSGYIFFMLIMLLLPH